MKQYTNQIQTAKLIELGFEKPKSNHRYWRGNELVINTNYSIGELIEFLPESINWHSRKIIKNTLIYSIGYQDEIYVFDIHEELIDNLFDACVQFKENNII